MGRVSDAKEKLMGAVSELIWQGSYGSTTIDQICEKAGVRKGSFYYFFDSKSDLAAAALEANWQERKPELDAIFSPTVPPLDRIKNFCAMGHRKQVELKKQCGCVLGCPLYTLGSEICNQEVKLHAKIKEILGQYQRYLETAIRDADAAGEIDVPDAAARARILFACLQGIMAQARILNDTDVLRDMVQSVLAILGSKPARRAAA
jgi:TetR/AcrR family transcriptional regulator, transcriptional repressor for nem operon